MDKFLLSTLTPFRAAPAESIHVLHLNNVRRDFMSVPDNDRVTDCPVDAARRRRHAVDEDAHWRVRRAGDGELGAHRDLLARRLGDARVLALVVVLNVLDIEATAVDTTTLETRHNR